MIWLLHGNLGSPSDWDALLDNSVFRSLPYKALDLAAIFKGVAPPLQQSGRILADFIGNRDSSPVLCGYSLGGRLAMHAFLAQPQLCRGLILLGAHPGLEKESDRMDRIRKDAQWSALLQDSTWEHFYKDWTSQPVFEGGKNRFRPAPSLEEAAFFARSFKTWSLGKQENLALVMKRALARSCAPVLLLSGERDTKFTHLYQALGSQWPGTQHVMIPKAGHRLLEDAPEQTGQIISTWYQTHISNNETGNLPR